MICLKIKEMAAEKRVSLSKLSRRADVDPSHLRKMYRAPCSVNITLETLNRLAWALGCDACELIEYTADGPRAYDE